MCLKCSCVPKENRVRVSIGIGSLFLSFLLRAAAMEAKLETVRWYKLHKVRNDFT